MLVITFLLLLHLKQIIFNIYGNEKYEIVMIGQSLIEMDKIFTWQFHLTLKNK